MILWLILAAMSLLAAAMLVWPLLRRAPDQLPRDAYDLEIYRDQLAELDRDVDRELIPEDQADAARAEIGRRVLAADQALQDHTEQPPAAAARRALPVAVCVIAPVLAVLLYLQGGMPHLTDSGKPAKVATNSDAHDIAPMIEKLKEKLRQSPDDLEGWTMLARSLFSVSRFGEAASAYANALAMSPGNAGLMARQAESLSFENDGQVTPNARRLFAEAARIDPKNARALYYIALAKLQSGKRREALEDWRGLVAGAAPDAPWLPTLRKRIARLSAELDGGAAASLPAAPAAPGPSASDIKAAQSMSKSDRGAMIRSMVQRLADRLKDEPGDADGWLRLGRAYGVLGDQHKSSDAYGKAAKLRPGDITVLTSYAQILLQIAAKGETPPELADLGRRMLAIDPKNANGLWLAGLAAKATGDGEAAGRHWRLLLSLLPPGAPERKRVTAEIEALARE